MRIGLLLASSLLAVSCAPENDNANQLQTADTVGTSDGATGSEVPPGQPVTAATYVMRAAMSDMYEIEAGRLAMDEATSAETREFAQMMVDDHTASTRDLMAAVERGGITVTPPAELDSEHQGMIDRLDQSDGEEFDREYLQQQATAHRKALDMHRQFQETGDNPELKSFAAGVVPVIQKHADRLRQMGFTDDTSGKMM